MNVCTAFRNFLSTLRAPWEFCVVRSNVDCVNSAMLLSSNKRAKELVLSFWWLLLCLSLFEEVKLYAEDTTTSGTAAWFVYKKLIWALLYACILFVHCIDSDAVFLCVASIVIYYSTVSSKCFRGYLQRFKRVLLFLLTCAVSARETRDDLLLTTR